MPVSFSNQHSPIPNYTIYLIIAISLLMRFLCIGSSNLLVEEAYYWNYSQHLDFGYLDHPPMVAALIKLFTTIFGMNEFSVRFASIFCWGLTAFFSFKLSELIRIGTGKYAVMLLAILPFFFLQSLVITPDQPLTACWAAALYYLYRALILNQSRCWYITGVWLGLGMLSKYSIALLGPATLLYVGIVPSARQWLTRKEPYICILITALLFTPVLYWNATHEWASFLFQSARRLKVGLSFTFHEFLGILILFLTPLGLIGLGQLYNKKTHDPGIEFKAKRFLQLFTLVPLVVFGIFSLNHEIKFNWIGPGFLALIPWLALLIANATQSNRNGWLWTSGILFFCYGFMMVGITLGTPEFLHKKALKKFIAWDDLTRQLHTVAKHIAAETNSTPIFVPLDLYNISSELTYYQAKFLAHHEINQSYPILGRHIFGGESLMYSYWSPKEKEHLAGKTLIFVSNDLHDFERTELKNHIIEQSTTIPLWSHSQGRGIPIKPYYYKVVQVEK